MHIKAQVNIDGIVRDIFIDTKKDLTAIKFTETDLRVISTWPSITEVLVMGNETFMQANMTLVKNFMKEWPMAFFSAHKEPTGTLIDPGTGRLIDKNG